MKSNWIVDADLNARLTLTIEQSEYSDAVEKQLADYRKKARIPGFRPGTAPMTLIRKQYQEPITADEINKRLQDELYAFLDREKIELLGGGSRIPIFTEIIRELCKEVGRTMNNDESLAMGGLIALGEYVSF
jgi:FKBP-type peptidyl-prolyl cis-trans isomerase (trigger factor)